MLIEISTTGFVIRDLEYAQLDEEDFRFRLDEALRQVEKLTALKLEGAFEYDHICKTLRIDFDDDRTLPGSCRQAAEAYARDLTEDFSKRFK